MKQKGPACRQAGQIIIILLLGMLVALTIGLAIVQNSSTDLSFSTKSEQSSRAFSAAEAGIEYSLLTGSGDKIINLVNQATADVKESVLLPESTSDLQIIEYPPISRSKVAQFWLANPNTLPVGAIPSTVYNKGRIIVYWGSCSTDCPSDPSDPPAIEVSIVNKNTSDNRYYLTRFFLDSDSTRVASNNFTYISGSCSLGGVTVNTILQNSSKFYCNVTLDIKTATEEPIIARIRPLYSKTPQKVAIGSIDPNDSVAGRFPPQVSIVTSKGTSGQTERVLKGFRAIKVIPNFFDYGVFSVGAVSK